MPTPAAAAASNSCTGLSADDQNSMRVTASHGKVFYIDSSASSSLDAAYVSYKIENRSSSSARTNIWATVDTFLGGVVGLANPATSQQPLGDIAASGSSTAFFLLKATASTVKAQSHVVHVYSGKPGTTGATELYSCTFSFAKVSETIKAAANKVTSMASTSVTTVGSTMTVTVEGNTGTIGAGNAIDGSMVWISPAGRSSWPTEALRLESTTFSAYTNNSRNAGSLVNTWSNQLRIPLAGGSRYYYTAVYTFRIVGKSAVTAASVVPIAQIASGTQIKHTDLSSLSSATVASGSTSIAVKATKTVAAAVDVADGFTTFSYTVNLTNTGGGVSVDQVLDTRDAGLTYVPGTAKYNGVAIADPTTAAGAQTAYTFSGPFVVPTGTSGTPTVRSITYKMTVPTCTGTFLLRNSAVARIGTVTIGSGSSTYSVARAGGTCGSSMLTTFDTIDESLPMDVTTSPATTVTTTAARINGVVDPNGTAGSDIVFEYSTSPTLTGATTVVAGQTTSAGISYAVGTDLTGLASGTTYYFRAHVGTVYGETLSFVTTEVPAAPTATTASATDVTNAGAATLNGTIDPNQVVNGAKAKFQYAPDSSGGACTTLGTTTTTGYVQSETDSGTEDAVMSGSFPSDVSIGITGLTFNAWYCVRVVAYYNAATADWSTSAVAPNWVPLKAVVKSAQTLTFSAPATQYAGTTVTAGAVATSGLTASYESNTTDVCTVSGAVVTLLTLGTCSITASQGGNEAYTAATPVTVAFAVIRQLQSITFTTAATGTAGDSRSLTATTTAAGLAVEYSAGPSDVCSVTEGVLLLGPNDGECEITATQPGSSVFSPAPSVTRIVSVQPGPPVVVTTSLPDGTIDSSYSAFLEAMGGNGVYSNWTLVSGILPDGLFFTEDGEIYGTPTAASVVDLEFSVVSDGQTSETATLSLTILRKSQEITASGVALTYGDAPAAATASTDSGLPVVYATSDTSVVTVSPDGAITVVGVGTATVTVTADGDEEYLDAADVTFEVTVDAAVLTVTASSPTVTYGDAPPAYIATVTGYVYAEGEENLSALPECSSSYTSASAAGSAPTVTCSGAAAANYTFSYVAGVVTVLKATQVVTLSPLTLNDMAPSSTQAFGATALGGVVPTIVGSGECSWGAGIVTATAVEGSCTVTVSVAESANHLAAADVVLMLDVAATAKANRSLTIDLDVPGTTHPMTSTLTVVPTVSPDDPAIGYEVDAASIGICEIGPGTAITLLAPGYCSITATIAEDDGYNQVSASVGFLVTRVARTIGIAASASSAEVGSTITLGGSPSAGGGTVSYSIVTGDTHCSLSGATITATSVGFCGVNASVVVDGAYEAATSVTIQLHLVAAPAPLPSASASPSPSPSASASSEPTPAPTATTVPRSTTPAAAPEEEEVVLTSASGGSGEADSTPPRGARLTPGAVLPRTTTAVVPIGSSITPGAPARSASSESTIDVGSGVQPAIGSTPSLSAAQRTIAALRGEALGGFAPRSGVVVQVTGARTVGQFLVTPASVLDTTTIAAAIEESRQRLASEFAALDSASIVDEPSSAQLLGGPVSTDARRVFSDAGLGAPVTAGTLRVSSAIAWVSVSAHADGYVAGSVVYLTITTDPVIVAAAIVGRDGTAQLSGLVPADLLADGAHDVRVVGIRQLSGVTSDGDGTVVLSESAMTEVQRFDVGTQATVRLLGANSSGGAHEVVRVIPLVPEAPWWTVVVLALAALLAAFGVALLRRSRRWVPVVTTAALVVIAILPIAVGWLTRAYEVTTWGAIVALAAVGLVWIVRAATAGQREERRHSAA